MCDRVVALAARCGDQEEDHGNTRHRFYPPASPVEPREPMGHVKVLLHGAKTRVACQIVRCSEQPIVCGERAVSPRLKAGVLARNA
jgi:hypothetical protein